MRWLSILRDRVWPEVRHTWPFFLFVIGPAVAYVLAVVAGRLLPQKSGADQVRYFGTWLQLFGILLVAQGVRELRREFNRPTVLAAMRSRFGALVQSLRRREAGVELEATVRMSASVEATLITGRKRDTLEQRIEALERDLGEFQTEVRERERQFDSRFGSLQSELSKERQERSATHAEMTRKLDNLAVGGLHLDIIGLWWLLIATIATSVPDGVAWVLHSLSTYFS